MPYEIWAIDRSAGEAVLRRLDEWYLLSIHERWRPLSLDVRAVSIWSQRSRLIPVHTEHTSLVKAVMLARSLCLNGQLPGSLQVDEIEALWVEFGWFGPAIEAYCGPLDRYFESHGLSEEASFHLTLQALSVVAQKHGQSSLGEDIGLALFAAAQILYRQQSGKTEERPEAGGLRSLDERKLSRLTNKELACLRLWVEPAYDLEDLVVLLRLGREVAELRLAEAAGKLNRSPEQLKDPRFAEICRREILIRLEMGSWE